jgi:hypothetical protein
MSRRNQGPKLRWLAKHGCFYITWTEHGRSRERSTGTADRQRAEEIFGEWLHIRSRRIGPSDPSEMLVTDLLAEAGNCQGWGRGFESHRPLQNSSENSSPDGRAQNRRHVGAV